MDLRPDLGPADRQDLARLLEETPEFNADEVATALELVDERLADPHTSYRFLLAHQDGELLGYICWGRTPMTVATVDLYWLVTSRRRRRTGVGRALCTALERLLVEEGVHTVRVETGTRPLYEPTIQFYRSIGYREAGRIPDFYDAGDDLLILIKRLDEA